jgi:ABC-type multidrug transport system fused ATPase/permease subunit
MPDRQPTVREALGRFVPFLRPHRAAAALAVAFSFAALAANLVQAGVLERLIDAALARGPLTAYALIYGAALLVDIASAFAVKYSYGAFSARYLRDLRFHAVDHLQGIPIADFEKRHSGDLLSRLSNDLAVVQDFMGETLLDAFRQLVMLLAAVFYMAFLDWRLLVVSVLPVPLALIAVNLMTRNMYGWFRKAGDSLGKANALAQDALGGILTVKAYNLQGALARKYGASVDEAAGYDTKAAGIMRWTPPFNILLRAMPTVFCIGYGSYLIIRGELSPGQLIAFNYMLGFVQWPLAFLPDLIVRIKRAMGSGTRVAEILDIAPERSGGTDFSEADSAEALAFDRVSFAYGGGPDVLKDLSFSLRSGEKLAIVGPSGCGKSTVLKLLRGDYETHAGEIRARGRDTRSWELAALRSLFAVISQDIFLFPASVAENIAYGRPGASREEIVAAAEIANAREFIEAMPDGYDTRVGERGIKLSGGQRQRIALARAVIKGSPILLLDEPTSALDTHSEALVQEAIDRSLARKTAVIVAHRLSTIKGADSILVMDKGSAAERGGHAELMARGGLYAALYARQFNSEEVEDGPGAEADRG